MSTSKTPKQRFEEKYTRKGKNECWEWLTGKDKDGYGKFWMNNKDNRAHQVSYVFYVGETKGLFVCHTCDNPSCVNPNHLFLGTSQDNMDDKIRKGRDSKGETNGMAKLTEKQVREIRYRLGLGHKKRHIARDFNVSDFAIHSIHKGKTWVHVS